ncbi:MAG: homocysteine S-methyltransferase family protein [Armatimonadota bacterium]
MSPRADRGSLVESLLSHSGVAVGDGAMGTLLQDMGLPLGEPADRFCLERPQAVAAVHHAFAGAGAAWVQTNSFGATRTALAAAGLPYGVAELNAAAARIAREAAPGLPVLGTLGPSRGPASAWESAYAEQAEALAAGGVSAFLVETIVSLPEGAAAVRAAAALGEVWATVVPDAAGRLLDGSDLLDAAERLRAAGAAVVGVNCGAGPGALLEPAARLAVARIAPVLAAPSAGLPEMTEGRARYTLGPDAFAAAAIEYRKVGVRLFAGCCGATPDHLRAVVDVLTPGARTIEND